jgi:enoyl-CoA hydratase/carnithine racemase
MSPAAGEPPSPTGDLVLCEDQGPVRMLTLNRPERRNAFTADSYRLLARLLAEADRDPGVGAVLVRGSGPAFSSGVDLAALSEGPDAGAALAETFDRLIEALSSLGRPLLAAVQGPAVGFGATILLHCDLVVVSDDARLRFPFTALGTAPEAASSVLLPATVGDQRAAELLYTSRWVDAEEAVAMGLALRSCAPEDLQREAIVLAEAVAGQPRAAVAGAKRLLRAGRAELVRGALDRERAEAHRLGEELGHLGAPGQPGAGGPGRPLQ